jgi:hypothetical protein
LKTPFEKAISSNGNIETYHASTNICEALAVKKEFSYCGENDARAIAPRHVPLLTSKLNIIYVTR